MRLSDVLKLAGLEDPIEAQEKGGMEHVRFHGLDGMMASSKWKSNRACIALHQMTVVRLHALAAHHCTVAF